jgi:hypothetical protein
MIVKLKSKMPFSPAILDIENQNTNETIYRHPIKRDLANLYAYQLKKAHEKCFSISVLI